MERIERKTKQSYYTTLRPKQLNLNILMYAGQHVIIRASSSTSSRDYLTRQYSVLSEPLDAGYFDLLIKLYEKGRMSSLIRNWKLGCHVLFRGPFGDFEHKPGRYCQLILFCQETTGYKTVQQQTLRIKEINNFKAFFKSECLFDQGYRDSAIFINSSADFR